MFQKLCLVALISVLACKGQSPGKNSIATVSSKKPNVLIIYPDQLRRYSAGFWSEEKYRPYAQGAPDPVLTPNIDALAKNGVVFQNAVSNFPLCSPARGMFLSGRYPEQNGIWNNCRRDREESLRDDIPAITDLFYEAGYNTSYFGKCHWLKNEPLFDTEGDYVGSAEAPGGNYMNRYDTYIPPGASRHNIEYFYQSIKDVHFDPLVYSNDPNVIDGKKDGEQYRPKIFSAKNEAEKIIGYLKNQNKVRDPEKPFFMMWSINPPHNPWDDKNTDMDVLHQYYDTDKYPVLDTLVVRKNANMKVANYARHYFANVTSIDHYIGQVLNQLKEMGELDNTIVVFSADHGEMMGSHSRKGKNAFETESLGIPFIVHWPEGIDGGRVTDVLFSVPDVLPTTMSLAGIGEKIPEEVEGIDFAKKIVDPTIKIEEEPEGILLLLHNSRGVLSKDYTLQLQEENKARGHKKAADLKAAYLFDNKNDPYQLTKIPLEEKPEAAKKLLNILAKELERTNDPWFQKRKYSEVVPYRS